MEEFKDIIAFHGYSSCFEDTDDLNATLSVLALCLLHRYNPFFEHALRDILFPGPDVPQNFLKNVLGVRPPCRWQKFRCSLSSWTKANTKEEVEVVLDMGHNPAAIHALVKRANLEYKKLGYDMWYGFHFAFISVNSGFNDCFVTSEAHMWYVA